MNTEKTLVLFCAVCGEHIRVGEHCLLIHRRSGRELGRAKGHYAGQFNVRENEKFGEMPKALTAGENPNSFRELLISAEKLQDSKCFAIHPDMSGQLVAALRTEQNISGDHFIVEMYKGVPVQEQAESLPYSGVIACHSVCASLCQPAHIRMLPPSYWTTSSRTLPPRRRFLQTQEQQGAKSVETE